MVGFEKRTAIKFDTYSIDDGDSHLIDSRVLVEEYDINPAYFRPIEYVQTAQYNRQARSAYGRNYNRNFQSPDHSLTAKPNLDSYGLHITYGSTDAKEVRRVVDRTMRRLRDEMTDQ